MNILTPVILVKFVGSWEVRDASHHRTTQVLKYKSLVI